MSDLGIGTPRDQRPNYSNREKSGRDSGKGSGPKGKNGWSRNGRDDRRQQNQVRFENFTGSSRAQEALKQIILRVNEANTGCRVNLRDESGKLVAKHLLQITNALDLKEEGLALINIQADADLPLVKKVSVKDMIQLYSDKLAAEIEEQLIASGNARAQRVVQNRLKVERKKSAAKIVNLAWAISISDMQNQKKKEIEKRIVSGEKFSINIGGKALNFKQRKLGKTLDEVLEENGDEDSELVSPQSDLTQLNDEDYELEIRKRERVFATVELILAEHRCRTSVVGSLEKQMYVNVEPIISTEQSSTKDNSKTTQSEQLSPKELRKLKRLEKAKGTDNTKSSAAESEGNPDDMYLFKIED